MEEESNTMADSGEQSIAVAHKDYAVAGGGERVAERLGQCFDAPVYVGFLNDENRSDIRADVRDLFGSGLTGLLVRRGGLTRQLGYRMLWKHPRELYQYDVVIQSGMEPLWYQPRDTQTTVAYVHSTPRCQYDLAPYLNGHSLTLRDLPGKLVQTLYDDYIRQNFISRKHYPDLYVANSELVARRLQRYWEIKPGRIQVVHPPVPVDEYGPQHAREQGEYYLSINRLAGWKRIDEVVDAFRQLDQPLKVAGKGPQEDALRERARDADNIEYLGYVSSREKKQLLAGASAVVYNPLNEDFGMVPIEALASGTPVIAVDDGYQQYQLADGETAVMYERSLDDRDGTVRALRAAVRRYEADGVSHDTEDLQAAAHPYRVERFETEMQAAVADAQARSHHHLPDTPPQPADRDQRNRQQPTPYAGSQDAAVSDGGRQGS